MVLGLGLGQLLITAGILYGIAILMGISQQAAIIIGFGLALSSTAFCLQLLSERGGISTLMGRMSFFSSIITRFSSGAFVSFGIYVSGW